MRKHFAIILYIGFVIQLWSLGNKFNVSNNDHFSRSFTKSQNIIIIHISFILITIVEKVLTKKKWKKKIREFLAEKILTDVIVIGNQGYMNAHKLILSIASPVLQKLFAEDPNGLYCKQCIIEFYIDSLYIFLIIIIIIVSVNILSASNEVLQALIGFAYYQQLKFEGDLFEEIYDLFKSLQIDFEFPVLDSDSDKDIEMENDKDIQMKSEPEKNC